MKKLLLLALPLLLASGCTSTGGVKPSCAVETKVVTPIAAFIASPAGLDCANEALIVSDLVGFTETLGLCQAVLPAHDRSMGGALGRLVCPPLVSWAVSSFINNSQKLQAWGCKGSGVQNAFSAACAFIPI